MWKDITIYSKDTPQEKRKPHLFEFRKGELIIFIVYDHIDCPNEWVMNCSRLEISNLKLINCKSAKEARIRSIQIVKMRLERLLTIINGD